MEVALDNHQIEASWSMRTFYWLNFLYLYKSPVWSHYPSRLFRFTSLIRSFAGWEKFAVAQKPQSNGLCRMTVTAVHPGYVGCLATHSLAMPRPLWSALEWQ